MRISLVGGSNQSRSKEQSSARTINLYPELDADGKAVAALYGRPGLVDWGGDAQEAVVRCIAPFGGVLIAVVGQRALRINASGDGSLVGTVNTTEGPISWAASAGELMLVDGDRGYVWDGTTFAQITDVDFPNGATHVAFIDGYFLVNDSGGFAISAPDDATSWTATDRADAERDPDDVDALIVDHREVWLFGPYSTEVWYNSGDATFPFDPIESGFTEWGIAAPHSATKIDGSVYWLAQSKEGRAVIMKSEGFRGARISTHAIEEQIAAMSRHDDCVAYAMQMRGHVFVAFVFPTGGRCFIYDPTTQLFHEWESYGHAHFKGVCHAFYNGLNLVGDHENGRIYQLDFEALDDDGDPIVAIREDRHIGDNQSRRRLRHNAFELEMEGGVGTAAIDPQVMLQFSDDGGHIWSNETWRGVGKIGEYKTRARWNRLGASYDRTYRIKISDACKRAIVGAFVEAEVLTS